MKDIIERAAKTFVQAFFGCLIPSVAAALGDGWPEDLSQVWMVISPVLAASVAAGISAVWNFIKTKLDEREAKKNGGTENA